jgi:hypothetical protein
MSRKRLFLTLFEFLKKIYFIVFQNSINGVSFETLIVRRVLRFVKLNYLAELIRELFCPKNGRF